LRQNNDKDKGVDIKKDLEIQCFIRVV